jgi:uncharacterized membrane protein
MDQNQNAEQGATTPPPSASPMASAPAPAPAPAHAGSTGMAVLAYLSVLVLIPYLSGKNDPFVHYHVKQGVTLFGIEVLIWLVTSFIWFFGPLLMLIQLIDLAILVLAIIGIMHAVKGEQKPLPIIGGFAAGLNI